jgi:serine/threonine protein kinase
MAYKRGSVLKTAFDAYTLLALKGAGGCGEVHEAVDSDGERRAIKVLHAAKSSTTGLKRSASDFNFCFKNDHRNIVPVLDCGLTGAKVPFYVMPLYPSSLRLTMRKGMQMESVLPLFGKILDGMEAAHLHRVWHGHLKPENILLDETETEAAIGDFGCAPFLAMSDEGRGYAAPEQSKTGYKLDGKADVYALGRMLEEMITGEKQGEGQLKIEDVAPEYGYLDWLIERMTKKDPAQRLTITEVKRELIARGIEYLSIQRLNALRTEIMLETDADDPLLRNPITVHSVDFKNETLFLTLSAVPPSSWVAAFHGLSSSASFIEFGPERFIFLGKIAQTAVKRGSDPQAMLNSAKAYVDAANRIYAEDTVAAHRRSVEFERQRKRALIAAEERRQQVLARLRL